MAGRAGTASAPSEVRHGPIMARSAPPARARMCRSAAALQRKSQPAPSRSVCAALGSPTSEVVWARPNPFGPAASWAQNATAVLDTADCTQIGHSEGSTVSHVKERRNGEEQGDMST
ncbi:hypothetical protein A9F13_01g08624 [Clavispora lusitaniae]|uniref:Uncharacterized protein n=1 Tax=Clavispora lusitaniae TaxID=36911 RepID=A0AA91T4D4_CLALS|nr:hypothetical protein A9F13_01g08624 [Clavispora lusitaniae]